MPTREEVEKVINDVIAPKLLMHGGSVELVDVDVAGKVKVKLQGACAGCPGAKMTLKMGVERILKESLKGVTEVVAV